MAEKMKGENKPEVDVVQADVEFERLSDGNSNLDSEQRVQTDGEEIVSNTKLTGVGLQDVREDLVESDLDIGLRKADVGITIVEWSQIQLHECTAVDLSAGRRG